MSEETKGLSILGTSYDMEEKLLDLAGQIFDDVNDISTLKTGMFGYITKGMGQVSKEGIFHRNFLYRERFLNTASLPASIYNFAKQQNYSVELAKPAKATLVLTLPARLFIGDNKTITLNRADLFRMGGFPFMLPYSVEIVSKGNAVTARYLTDTERAPNGEIELEYASNPFLKVWKAGSQTSGTDIHIRVDVYQMQTTTSQWEVYTQNITEQIFFDYTYKNQLAGFNVSWEGTSGVTPLTKLFNSDSIPTERHYCFYSFPDNQAIQVFFSPLSDGFRPDFGHKVYAETFTTQGSKGNFTFTGEVLYSKSGEIQLTPSLYSSPTGGVDRPSLSDIKRDLLELNNLRGNLISTRDLNSHFDITTRNLTSNGSTIEFRKKRDDVIRRIFSAFILMRDNDGNVVPTNTVDIEIPYATLEAMNHTILPGSVVIYDTAVGKYRFLTPDELPDQFIRDHRTLAYAVPYLIEMRMTPPRAAYYTNYVDDDVPVNFKWANPEVNREYIINSLAVVRQPLMEQEYTVACNLFASEDDDSTRDNIRVIAVIEDKGKRVGWFELQYDEESEGYIFKLSTDDVLDGQGRMTLTGDGINRFDNTGVNQITLSEDAEVTVAVMYRDEMKAPGIRWWTANVSGDDRPEEMAKFLDIEWESGHPRNEYDMATIMETARSVKFFESYNDSMHSQIRVFDDGTLTLTDLPLVGARYYFNTAKHYGMKQTLHTFLNVLRDSVDRLEENTDVDIKFFNTYGLSEYYDSPRVDITISLGIKLRVPLSEELDKAIREEIVKYILSTNASTTRDFSVSQLTVHLHQKFPQISKIIFNSISDMNVQSISFLYTDADIEEQKINATPEFLNVSMKRAGASALHADEPNIAINYL